MTEENSSRLVQSTMTSLRILEFIHEERGARLTDISDALDIGYSTAHNHLATLREQEWLRKENDVYEIPYRFLNYGSMARRNTPYFRTIRDHANELSKQTNTEVEFLVEEYGRIVSIMDITANAPGYGDVGDSWADVGVFYYMTNTASGKAMLAELSEQRIEAVLEKWGLPAQTPYSVTDRETLYQQLEAIRNRGYAMAHQEVLEGFSNASAAVTYPDGRVLGALSIGWPTYVYDDGPDEELIDELLATVAAIEAEIAE